MLTTTTVRGKKCRSFRTSRWRYPKAPSRLSSVRGISCLSLLLYFVFLEQLDERVVVDVRDEGGIDN